MRRRLGDGLLAVALGLAMCWYAVRWLDVPAYLVAVAQAAVPVAGALVVVTTVGAALLRRRRITVIGAVASVVVVIGAAPFVRPFPGNANLADDLMVMSSNLDLGGADVEALTAHVRALDVDVLVLVEATPEAVGRLRDLGLEQTLPYEAGQPGPGTQGTVIRSRFPMTERQTASSAGEVSRSEPVVVVELPQTGGMATPRQVVIRAIHRLPPTAPNVSAWRSSFDGLAAWAHSQPDGIPLLLVGDFNASADHPGFRKVAADFIDAHQGMGAGWVRTWPHGRRWVPPFVQIDHLLARGLSVTSAGSGVVAGTDHAFVWASWR